jgi:hypothetical protein
MRNTFDGHLIEVTVRGWGDYAWVRDPIWMLELRYGPFWEPERLPRVTSADDIVAAAVATETLVERIVAGRKRSLAWAMAMSAIAAGVGVVATARSFDGDPGAALLFGVLIVTIGPGLWWGSWMRDWPLAGVVLLLPTRQAPKPAEIVASLRDLTDAFSGAPKEDAVRAFGQMADITPLTYRACRRLTVVPGTIKKAV